MVRLMTREEVAGIIGVSPSMLTEMVKEANFPGPVSLGKSSRTDRWPSSVVEAWIKKKEGVTYGGAAHGASASPSDESVGPQYFTIGDIAKTLNVSQQRVFSLLVAGGMLQDSGDENSRYRPAQAAFERGLFWRVEKFTIRDKRAYFQTVVPTRARDEILRIVHQLIEQDRQK